MNFGFSQYIKYNKEGSTDSKPSTGGSKLIDSRRGDGHTSLDSLRTRLDSSNSDNDKHKSTSPRMERPIPIKAPSYYPWNLKSLFSQINFMSQTQMHNGLNLHQRPAPSGGLADMIKQQMAPKPVNLKPTKIYDKFDISDLEGMKLGNMQDYDEDSVESPEEVLDKPSPTPPCFEEEKEQPAENYPIADNHFMTLVKANQEFNNLKGVRKLNKDDSPTFSESSGHILPQGFWGSKSTNEMVGLLSRNERDAKVKRYLEKKKRRKQHLNTMVRYECRKDLADRRFRFQGRFVKLEDLKELEKDYIFDSHSKRLIKPIFKTQKILSRYRSMSNTLNSLSNEDVSMEASDEN